MLAVGVVIGGAFNAIVTSFVNMLLSIATWPVPGGLKGFVTVLPALTNAQKGAAFEIDGRIVNLQSFTMAYNEREFNLPKHKMFELIVQISFIGKIIAQFIQSIWNNFYLKPRGYRLGSFITIFNQFLIIAIVLLSSLKPSIPRPEKAELEVKSEQYYENIQKKTSGPRSKFTRTHRTGLFKTHY